MLKPRRSKSKRGMKISSDGKSTAAVQAGSQGIRRASSFGMSPFSNSTVKKANKTLSPSMMHKILKQSLVGSAFEYVDVGRPLPFPRSSDAPAPTRQTVIEDNAFKPLHWSFSTCDLLSSDNGFEKMLCQKCRKIWGIHRTGFCEAPLNPHMLMATSASSVQSWHTESIA